MMKRASLGSLLIVLSFSLAAAQDGPTETPRAEDAREAASVIASVNGQPVYLEDVERQLNRAHNRVTETQRSAYDVERLIDRVVNDELLAQEARVLELQDDDFITRQVNAMRRRMAIERLAKEEITDRIEISVEETRKLFQEEYSTVSFHMLTADSEEEATGLRARLFDGADFEELAREHSVDQTAPRGGLVENQERLRLPPEIIAAMWALEPGQLTEPVRTGKGWSVFRVDAFNEPEPERFGQLDRQLRDQIRFRKSERYRVELAKRLEEALQPELDMERVMDIGCRKESDGRLVPVVDEPTAVIARIGERSITADRLEQALKKRWRGVRNEEAALATRRMVFTRMVHDELMEVEALRRGYDGTAAVWRAAHSLEKQLVIKRYLNEVLAPQVEVTDQETQELYELRREEFRKPPRLHLGQITVETEEKAEKLAQLLREGADLAWLARQHSKDRFKDAGGARGWVVPEAGVDAFQDRLIEAQPRDVLGPSGDPGHYVVVQVGAREEQGYEPLEQVDKTIRSAVFRRKFQEHLGNHLETLRSRSEIEIHEEVVASLSITATPLEEPDAPAAPHGMP